MYTGKGVRVAVIDSGIARHIDLEGRIIAFKDFVGNKANAYDDNGHGSCVAGIIAGSGRGSRGRIRGTAVKAELIGVKVLDKNGAGDTDNLIKASDWLIENKKRYNIKIINISMGAIDNSNNSRLIKAVDNLWDHGMTVVVSAGNNGPKSRTITNPGISKNVITVGAYDIMRATDANGKVKTYYSSQGPTKECVMKPEIVARGNQVAGCKNARYGYVVKSGTSMAVPYITGMIARLLEKYPDMTPYDVRQRLQDRAIDIGLPRNLQGWGRIDESLLN